MFLLTLRSVVWHNSIPWLGLSSYPLVSKSLITLNSKTNWCQQCKYSLIKLSRAPTRAIRKTYKRSDSWKGPFWNAIHPFIFKQCLYGKFFYWIQSLGGRLSYNGYCQARSDYKLPPFFKPSWKNWPLFQTLIKNHHYFRPC